MTSSTLSFAAPAAIPATRLYARASADFADKLAETQALLQQAATEFTAPDGTVRVTQASSLGAEDVVITHLINSLGLALPIFVLETGALHAETLSLLERTVQTSQAPVAVFKPKTEAVVTFVAREGSEAMYKSIALRKACCTIRKLEPLERALAGKDAWITGLRREQSGNRAEVPLRDTTELEAGQANARIKLNPLARWTWGDVWHYIATHHVDHNPLHDQFYPSIGCAPCTRAISLGEDFRSGRWWWEADLEGGSAKECGLHATHTTAPTAPTAHPELTGAPS
jgi:phosphoadenosine phosphosulfate reductase